MSAADIFRVGLTGGIGSGKSTVADRFVSLGATLVDTDAIAHRLTAPGGGAIGPIRERFGAAMITGDGRLDRAAMRVHVFNHPAARQSLEAILHPMIRSISEQEVAAAAAAGADYAILAIPLLVESGRARHRVERVLVVDCPEEVQIARVMKRSALPREQVEAIMRAQATRQQRLAVADDVIDNGGDEASLDAQVQPLHDLYVALGKARKDGQRQAIATSPSPAPGR
jgi:dephospho-CoA kinase